MLQKRKLRLKGVSGGVTLGLVRDQAWGTVTRGSWVGTGSCPHFHNSLEQPNVGSRGHRQAWEACVKRSKRPITGGKP